MGKVVKLEKGASKSRARARAQSRTALVLGGGGFTGGVYEIGALRALDLLSVNRSVNQFDIYVGTWLLTIRIICSGVMPLAARAAISEPALVPT